MKEQIIWREKDFPNHDVNPKSLAMMLRIHDARLVNIMKLESSDGQTEQIIIAEKEA